MSCHDFQLNSILVCEGCGLELQVVKECDCEHKHDGECECEGECTFECCGKPLAVKQ